MLRLAAGPCSTTVHLPLIPAYNMDWYRYIAGDGYGEPLNVSITAKYAQEELDTHICR